MSDTKFTTGEIQTKKGVLKFELYDDDAPGTVANLMD
jgi:cyclophilin family peptidyl-prolyl cis-trans isomerase